MYMYNLFTLLHSWNEQNIVNQLYFIKNFLKSNAKPAITLIWETYQK